MMNTLVIKKLRAGLLLAGFACTAALAQQPSCTTIPSGTDDTMPEGAAPSPDQAAPMPGGSQSGASGTSGGSAAGMGTNGSISSELVNPPEIPGARGQSDADPYQSGPGEAMRR